MASYIIIDTTINITIDTIIDWVQQPIQLSSFVMGEVPLSTGSMGSVFEEMESQRLFSKDVFAVQVTCLSDQDKPETLLAIDEVELNALIENRKESDKCLVPSGFLDFVHSFGYRSKDTDTNFGGYIRNISWSTNSLSNGRISDISSDSTLRPYLKSAELGYHIRYPEDYKNDLPDSWVIRQLAVSETFDCEAHNSAWLILQCPTTLRKKLQDIGFPEAVSEHDANKGSRLMMFHILILESVAQKWRTYIEYLEKMIEETSEKARGSRFEAPHPYDYNTNFADAQSLHSLHKKILKAKQALESSLDVNKGLSIHYHQLLELHLLPKSIVFILRLELHAHRLKTHLRSVDVLISISERTNLLLLKLLDYRNDETRHQNGESLKQLAELANKEGQDLRIVFEMAMKDSKVLKTLTFIAMIYLPAGLVATIFSSQLVSLQSTDASGKKSQLISTGIWLYVVVTVTLLSITIAAAMGWEKVIAKLRKIKSCRMA